jgi:hypothetical protein
MMKQLLKQTLCQSVPARSKRVVISVPRSDSRDLTAGLVMDEEGDDPLTRAQVLASIRAAKRLHLPTGEALRAVRRQIDID